MKTPHTTFPELLGSLGASSWNSLLRTERSCLFRGLIRHERTENSHTAV